MNIFRKNKNQAPLPEEPRFGYSRDQLNEVMGSLGTGSALQEDFLVGEEGPSGMMTDSAHDLLKSRLKKVAEADRKKKQPL